MTSLTEFMLARLSEDEAEIAPHAFLVWNFNDHDGEPLKARVLAQVEALRAVVEMFTEEFYRFGEEKPTRQVVTHEGERVLLTLAQPFRDHPDFDPSWLT